MLYLHVPFCESRCGYCAFNTFSGKGELINDYVNALSKQLIHSLSNTKKLSSVYFGGGTPSMLEAAHFEKLFEIFMPLTDGATEITIEANPSSWNYEKAKALLGMGANRLSLGVQSLDDKKLAFLSRVHDRKSAINAYEASVKAGFENISVDFMYDTPFDDEKFVNEELTDFLALEAEHISAYSLTIEENTPFEKQNIKTRYDAKTAKDIATTLTQAGYEHYEVASFGRIRSKHNFGYWEYKEYIGVGAGAVGFDGKRRIYPHTKIEEYIKNPVFAKTEELSSDDMRAEKILLGLRSAVGVDKSLLVDKGDTVQMLVKNSLLSESGERVYCMDFFLADEIAVRLA
ncbi:MAG: radical SAM family heme chaperone HemW [Campylobacterales bacterium]|nr:radical SAM family heme chaperone HemW [Campylobacterales bacterium]